MKILLVALNAKYIHSNLALLSLRANSGKYRENADILELSINNSPDFAVSEIFRRKPDVVCFSCYIWNMELIAKIIPVIKKVLPGAAVLLGGPEASYEYDGLFCLGADIIMIGEGEGTFFELARYFIDKDIKLNDIKGIAYMEKGLVAATAGRPPLDLNSLVFPYDEEILKGLENKIIYYESSRGCPFRCAYCLSSIEPGVRVVEGARLFSDLDFFIENKVKLVKFVDRTFNFSVDRAKKIWHYLIKNDKGFTKWHFEISGGLFDEEALELLSGARPELFQLEIGIQSANSGTLKSISRSQKQDRLYENIKRLVAKGNIHVHLDLIAGLPEEGFKSFGNSFNEAVSLRPHMLQLGFLKLLKGSELRERQKVNEEIVYNQLPPYEVLYTKSLAYSDLLALKDIEEVFELYYNSGRFKNSVDFAQGLYETPFEFYQVFANYWRERQYFNLYHGKNRQYEIFYEFCRVNELKDLLKLDFLLSENAKALPAFMQEDMERFNKFYKNSGNLSKYLAFDGPPKLSAGKIRGFCNIASFNIDAVSVNNRKYSDRPGHKLVVKALQSKQVVLFDYREKPPRLTDISEAFL